MRSLVEKTVHLRQCGPAMHARHDGCSPRLLDLFYIKEHGARSARSLDGFRAQMPLFPARSQLMVNESQWPRQIEVHPIMSDNQESEQRFPLKFTPAQRKALAEVLPEFAERLKLDEPNHCDWLSFSLDEMRAIHRGRSPCTCSTRHRA